MRRSLPSRALALWLLLIPAAAGLVLLVARAVGEQRAQQAAMSAELLAPMEEAGGPVASEPGTAEALPEPRPTSDAVSDTARRAAEPGDLRELVPAELAGALVADTLEPPPPPPPLDPTLFSDWTTYEDAVAKSRSTGRPVLLAFTALRCETCESLREAVFDDVAGSVTIRSAVIPVVVKDLFLDTGENARLIDDLQKRFGITTFPTLVVWSPATQRTRTLKGFRGAAATLRFITDSASSVN